MPINLNVPTPFGDEGTRGCWDGFVGQGYKGPMFGDNEEGGGGGCVVLYILYTIHIVLEMLVMKRCVTI